LRVEAQRLRRRCRMASRRPNRRGLLAASC